MRWDVHSPLKGVLGPQGKGAESGSKRIREIGMFIAHYTDCPPQGKGGWGHKLGVKDK